VKKRQREIEYLEQIQKIDELVIDLQADANRWREIAFSIGSQSKEERVQSSKRNDSLTPIEMALDAELEIKRLMIERQEIINDIKSLPSPECGILFKKYVLGMDYYDILDRMNNKKYTYSWATTIHGNGLQLIKKILDERNYNEN
jgi:hypothetical protein